MQNTALITPISLVTSCNSETIIDLQNKRSINNLYIGMETMNYAQDKQPSQGQIKSNALLIS